MAYEQRGRLVAEADAARLHLQKSKLHYAIDSTSELSKFGSDPALSHAAHGERQSAACGRPPARRRRSRFWRQHEMHLDLRLLVERSDISLPDGPFNALRVNLAAV
jgi:hypothetical protein